MLETFHNNSNYFLSSGTDVKSGDDVLSYVPSFSFELNEARDKLDVETLTKKP